MASLMDRIRAFVRPSVVQISLNGDAPTQVLNYTAKSLYQTQDNLQAAVNFLANSVAQLPLKVYRRTAETHRERDRTSTAAKLLYLPNLDQTAFEFFRGVAEEYFVFGAVYVWVIPSADTESGYQMRIIPSDWVTGTRGGSVYAPEYIQVSTDGIKYVEIPRSEWVRFSTYSPGNPGGYVSPISALRQTLTEQIEAGRFRKELWHSSGRLNAQIIRPKDVIPWDDNARRKFTEAFRESWSAGGAKAGSIPLLEDGMEIKPFSTSFKESEWAASVKLSRESVAAAYMVNPSLIWHSDTQTYASSKDNARALYAECLGPVLQMLQQRINSFLLPMVGADPELYVEFDLAEKLKGSFEERASILQSAVGGPWMTRNEARADNNLPPIPGGDELIVPLNVVEGGQASPTDTQPKGIQIKAEETRIKASSTTDEDEAMTEAVKKFFARQRKSILPKIGAGQEWWDEPRWIKELADDIEPLIDSISDTHGREVAKELKQPYNADRTRKYLRALSEGRAKAINSKTFERLDEAIEADEDPEEVFDLREGHDAPVIGASLASTAAGWAIQEAARQARGNGYEGEIVKEWVTGENPRPTHASMNGERVPIDEPFSNGAMWPGDDNLDADESCGCNCHTDVIITR